MDSPPRSLPPLDLLRGFESAARHLSFTRAAAELFLTQSAVSRQIQALEEFIGVPLFERRHKALVLTEAGQAYYRTVAPVLDQLFWARPALGYADYRSPLKGLYHCGSGAHPGGGVTGAPGHNAARAIVADRRWKR